MPAQLKQMGSNDDLEAALASSESGPTWLLKHSNSCDVSDDAYEEFSAHAEAQASDAHWVLTVQKSPALSQAVAARLGVAHDTPQVILLFERQVRWVATHWDVRHASLDDALAALTA
jgi:bacillithiol system protein YtxJ